MTKSNDRQALLESLNNKALKVIDRYQNIRVGKINVSTPYFFNAVENIYKDAMYKVGGVLGLWLLRKVLRMEKNGELPLGSGRGKGSPEEIATSLKRLVDYKKTTRNMDLNLASSHMVKDIMKEHHIGVECTGLVYNILVSTFKDKTLASNLDLLAWRNKGAMRVFLTKILKTLRLENEKDDRDFAGAFIFNSDKLNTIENLKKLQPLDLIMLRDIPHVGIIVRADKKLVLVDSAQAFGGITLNKLAVSDKGVLRIEDRPDWNRFIKNGNIIVKRFPVLSFP